VEAKPFLNLSLKFIYPLKKQCEFWERWSMNVKKIKSVYKQITLMYFDTCAPKVVI
jgi:hypothetical protein